MWAPARSSWTARAGPPRSSSSCSPSSPPAWPSLSATPGGSSSSETVNSEMESHGIVNCIYCIHSFSRIFFIAHQAAQKSAEKKEVAKPHEDAKLLQVISLRCRPQQAAKLAFKLTKLIHRFCQIFLLGLWPLEKEIDT